MDDFGVKYVNRKDAEGLMGCTRNHYEAITKYWIGSLYSGITLNWDYNTRKVHLFIPGYCMKLFAELQHKIGNGFTFISHPYVPLVYGKKVQIAKQEGSAPLLPKDENTRIRRVVGIFYSTQEQLTIIYSWV